MVRFVTMDAGMIVRAAIRIPGMALCFLLTVSVLSAAEYKIHPGENPDPVLLQLKPGDVLLVQAGVYTQPWTIRRLRGTADQPITIRGDAPASAKPVFRPVKGRDGMLFWGGSSKHVVVERLRFEQAPRAGIVIFGSTYITIRDCEMVSNGVWGIQTCLSDHIRVESCELAASRAEHGLYFSTTDHPYARHNYIHHNNKCGIHFNGDQAEGGNGMIEGGVVEGNRISENGRNGGAAINLDGVEGMTIRSNRLENNLAGGIASFVRDGRESGSRNVFEGNTVMFGEREGRYGLKITGAPVGIRIAGNLLMCGGGPALEIDRAALPGVASDDNRYGISRSTGLIRLDGMMLTLDEWRTLSNQDTRSVLLEPERMKRNIK